VGGTRKSAPNASYALDFELKHREGAHSGGAVSQEIGVPEQSICSCGKAQ